MKALPQTTAVLTSATFLLSSSFAFASAAKLSFSDLIFKRATSTTSPAAINIAPSQYWDGDDGPWSSFPLQVGNPNAPQSVRVQISTAATDIWTISPLGCPNGTQITDCINARGFTFNPDFSLTWIANSIYDINLEVNLGLDTSGKTGYDTVTLGWKDSGGPQVPHNVVFSLEAYTYFLGVFGLNPRPTNFTSFSDPAPSFMQQLYSNNTIPSLSWGYTAGNQYRLNKVFGSLVLGGYDANRMTSTNLSMPMYTDISRDLSVYLQAITSSSGMNLLPTGTIFTFIDSTVPYIYLPLDACLAFEEAFGLVWNLAYSLYTMNSSLVSSLQASNPSVTFTIGDAQTGGNTIDITLPFAAFNLIAIYPLVQNQTAYFPLVRATNQTQYTLGRTFLQEAYVFADYGRSNFTVAPCNWNQSAVDSADIKTVLSPNATLSNNATDIVTNNSSNGSSGLGGGAIAGVVVAIVAVIAIIGLTVFFVRRRKNQAKKARLAEFEAKSARPDNDANGSDKPSVDNEGRPFISRPMGDELGGGEIHELTAPYKSSAAEMESPYKHDPSRHGYSEMEGGGEDFAPGRGPGGRHEMEGTAMPIFEMHGSEVEEMHAPHQGGQ